MPTRECAPHHEAWRTPLATLQTAYDNSLSSFAIPSVLHHRGKIVLRRHFFVHSPPSHAGHLQEQWMQAPWLVEWCKSVNEIHASQEADTDRYDRSAHA